MQSNISELLDKRLSRKEFLQLVGGAIIALWGINNFINHLSQLNRGTKSAHETNTRHGFGSSKFGA